MANHTTDKYAEAGEVRADTAMMLDVPDSGVPWLDDMIREGLRDQFAMEALAGMMAQGHAGHSDREIADMCYSLADAMLAAREVSE